MKSILKLFAFSFAAILFLNACAKTDLENEALLKVVPGGNVSFSLSNYTIGSFQVTNNAASTYGCYEDKGSSESEGSHFHIRFSGANNGDLYYFHAEGLVSGAQLESIKSNPAQAFSIQNLRVEIDIMKGPANYFTTRNTTKASVPGTMTISNYGQSGDNVRVNFNFQTSIQAGFSDMNGTVDTRYVIYKF
ncbi:hypothetical protein [Chitinophaga sp. MM2321]|uniref:hypothetical protein n=1 Tax=Chitinophaga sp. MM2321 TaxID=3137178 RepID=UPI0032D56DC3